MAKTVDARMEQLRRLSAETMGDMAAFLTAEKLGKKGAALMAPMGEPLVGVFAIDTENYVAFGRSWTNWVSGCSATTFGYTVDCALEQRERGNWMFRVNNNLWLPVWPEICDSRGIERIVEFVRGVAEIG